MSVFNSIILQTNVTDLIDISLLFYYDTLVIFIHKGEYYVFLCQCFGVIYLPFMPTADSWFPLK